MLLLQSEVRQVPDNQEVFVDMQSDESIIVELLQLAEEAEDENVARYHFQHLADVNDATSSEIFSVQSLTTESFPFLTRSPHPITAQFLHGTQSISKYNYNPSSNQYLQNLHSVDIFMFVARIKSIETDILVTWNHPSLDQNSTEKERAVAAFMKIVRSFYLRDWGLFR